MSGSELPRDRSRPWLRARSSRLRGVLGEETGEKERVWFLRVVVIGLGIWAFLQIAFFQNVLQAALYAYTMYGAGVTPAVLAAFFWKRATPWGGALSVAAGMLATVAWEFVVQPALSGTPLGGVDPVIPAVAISLTTLIVVSLSGDRPSRDKWLPFFDEGYRSRPS